jgi:D-3-phosphoglycerate dehydrogenase
MHPDGDSASQTSGPTVLVIGSSYHTPTVLQTLEAEMRLLRCEPEDHAGVARALSQAHALVPSGHSVSRELLATAPRLLAVGVPSMGYDGVDVSIMTDAGVAFVTNTGIDVATVAELTVGLMLALARNVARADRLLRKRRDWSAVRHEFHGPLLGSDLEGKTLGIVGLGGIGARLASICTHGFRMRVLAYDPYLPAEHFAARGASRVETLGALAAEADYLTLHLPITEQTRHVIDASVLSAMKPTAYLVNIARGGVVDEAALVDALSSGRLAGAAIDTWEQEPPPPDHPFYELENVILTPHVGGVSRDSGVIRGGAIAQKLVDLVVRGERPSQGFINPEVWSRVVEKRAALGFT